MRNDYTSQKYEVNCHGLHRLCLSANNTETVTVNQKYLCLEIPSIQLSQREQKLKRNVMAPCTCMSWSCELLFLWACRLLNSFIKSDLYTTKKTNAVWDLSYILSRQASTLYIRTGTHLLRPRQWHCDFFFFHKLSCRVQLLVVRIDTVALLVAHGRRVPPRCRPMWTTATHVHHSEPV